MVFVVILLAFFLMDAALQRLVARLTSPKKVLAFIGAGLTLLAFARVVVLVVESYSAVWSERVADRELVRMCDSGTASMSADFRALCLKKRAEQSAPVLLKALLRACATAFTDFCESMSSPTKVVLLLLFCLTGVAAPVVKALSTLVVDNLRKRGANGRGTVRQQGATRTTKKATTTTRPATTIVVVTPDGSRNGSGGSAASAAGTQRADDAAASRLAAPRYVGGGGGVGGGGNGTATGSNAPIRTRQV